MHGLLLVLLTISTIFTGILTGYAWYARKSANALPFGLTMLALFVWSGAYIFEISVEGLSAKLFWVRIEYIGIVLLPVAWFWLAMQYAGLGEKLNLTSLSILCIVPLAALGLVWTSDMHTLFWKSIEISTSGPFPIFSNTFGPFFWIHVVYAYGLIFIGAMQLVQILLVSPHLQSKGAAFLLIGAIMPLLGNIPYLLKLDLLAGIDLTAVIFGIFSPILAYHILHSNLLDNLPVAFSSLIKDMSDGLLILDHQDRIIYLNSEAEKILECKTEEVMNKPVSALDKLPVLHCMTDSGITTEEIELEGREERQHYEVRISLLKKSQADSSGKMLLFRNITESINAHLSMHKRAEEHAALNSTLLDISNTKDLSALLETIVTRAIDLLEASGGEIYLTDREQRILTCVLSVTCPFSPTGKVLKFGEGAAGTVAETGQPLRIADYHKWPGKLTYPQATEEVSSLVSAPLLWRQEVIGVLTVLDTAKNRRFSLQDLEMLALFAGQAAIAVENSRLYAEAQQRAEELGRLYQAAKDLSVSLEPSVVLEQLARNITQAIDATSGYIIEVKQEQDQFSILAEYWTVEATRAEQTPKVGARFSFKEHKDALKAFSSNEAICFHSDDPKLAENDREIFTHHGVMSILIIPIVGRGRLLGAAILWESRRKRDFSQAEISIAQALAQHGAGVLENAHLYNSVRRRANELEALRATMADVSRELELPKLLQSIMSRAVGLIEASGGDLGIYDEVRQDLLIVVSYNLGRDFTGTRMALGEGAMGFAAKTMHPIIIPDYQLWHNRSPQYSDAYWHAAIAVPMVMGSRLLGSLGVVDADPRRQFTFADQYLINLFAQQAAVAIQNARMYEAARQAAERRDTLHQISQEIVMAHLDAEAIYESIHRAAVRIMPTEAFVISLLDPDTGYITAVYMLDRAGRTPAMTIPPGEGLSGFVIANGLSVLIDDVLTQTDIPSIRFGSEEEDVRSLVAVPMRRGGTPFGVLSCQSYQEKAYQEEDKYLLEMLAAYAAIALDNADLFSEVQYLAVTDPLTGVPNRRQFFELAQREFSGSQRFHRDLAAIMIDIDNFKQINDTFGHLAGDQILVAVAKQLKENIRGIDVLGRYGGDEFAIILPESNLETALEIAERLRALVVGNVFPTRIGPAAISISVGVSAVSEKTPSLESLLVSADTGMYMAKQAGRNRTMKQPENIEESRFQVK